MLEIFSDRQIEKLSTSKIQEEYFDPNFPEKGSFGIRVSRTGTKTFFLVCIKEGKKKRITLGRFPEIKYEEARSRAVSLSRKLRITDVINQNTPRNVIKVSGDNLANKKSSLDFNTPMTLAVLSARFIYHLSINNTSPKTRSEYQRILNKEVLPFIGHLPARSISRLHIRQILDDIALVRKRRPLANRTRSLLHRLFEFAIERDIRTLNPLARINKLPEKREHIPFLSLDDLHKLMTFLEVKRSETAMALKFMIATGASLTEVHRIRWSDIIENKWFLNRELDIDNTEANVPDKPRMILNKVAHNIIKFQAKKGPKSSFVFSSRNNKPIRYIEKSINSFGVSTGISGNLTARHLQNSMISLLREYSRIISPPLKPEEIDALIFFTTSGQVKHKAKKPNQDLEIGARTSMVLELLLSLGSEEIYSIVTANKEVNLAETDNTLANSHSLTNDTKPEISNGKIIKKSNVIFLDTFRKGNK